MVTQLIPSIGFPWAMRCTAFLLLGLLVIGNLCISSRLPPSQKGFHVKEFVGPFKENVFVLLTASSFFVYLGGFLPFTFIVVEARERGMGSGLAGYLVVIINAARCVPSVPSYTHTLVLLNRGLLTFYKQYIRSHHPRALRRPLRPVQHHATAHVSLRDIHSGCLDACAFECCVDCICGAVWVCVGVYV
jgi:hypothetical protein